MARSLALIVVILVFGAPLIQADEETLDEDVPLVAVVGGKYRFDLSLNRLDTGEGDIKVLLPGYTLALRPNLRINLTTSLLKQGDETQFGDTLFVVQYDPSKRLTASPYIPDTLGLNATIRAPTGNADEGFGVDTWLVSLGAGWGFNPYHHLWLVPAAYYESTFDEEVGEQPDEEIGISMDFIWFFGQSIWIGYVPTVGRNLEVDDWFNDHSLVVGKIFRNGFGLSLEYGRRDRLDFAAQRDDYTTLLNLYYIFGRAP